MKKIACVLLCLLLALAAVGCSSAPTQETTPATSTSVAPSTAASTEPATSAAPATSAKDPYKIVYVAKSLSNPLFILMDDGMKAKVEEINKAAGYEKVVYESQTTANESDVEQMLTLCDTLLTQDLDALVITPASSNSFADVVKKCNDKGIAFIDLDTKVDQAELDAAGAKFDVFVGTDNIQMGKDLFNSCVKAYDGKCKYIVLGGYEGASTHIDMMKGLEEAAAAAPATMERLDYQAADWNRNKAFEVAGALLTAHPDVQAFICFNDQMASGAMQAIESVGKVPGKDIKLFGSTFVGDAPQNIWDGKQESSVSRVPYSTGQIAMDQAVRLCDGLPVEHPNLKGNVIEIAGPPVTKADLVLGTDGKFYDKNGKPIEQW